MYEMESYTVAVIGAGHAGVKQHFPVQEWAAKPYYLQFL